MEREKICAFFGHRNVPNIYNELLEAIKTLIENENVDIFYVGSNGAFDSMVTKAVSEIRKTFPRIKLFLILAYMPNEKTVISDIYDSSIYANGLEFIPKKFAISHRNRWMVQQCDVVIAYVVSSYGGAYTALKYAKNSNKEIINLAVNQEATM